MQYVLTFLEGLLSFISPCTLPLLPVYISFFMGVKAPRSKGQTLINASFFVLGFSLVFCLLGLLAGTVSSFLKEYLPTLRIIGGTVMFLFGLSYLGLIQVNLFHGGNNRIKVKGALSALMFGIVYSVTLSPCVGPFLGAAIAMAGSSGSAIEGFFLLAAYSLGLGLPFIISALLLEQLKSLFSWIKAHYGAIEKLSGMLLVTAGLLLIAGVLGSAPQAADTLQDRATSQAQMTMSNKAAQNTMAKEFTVLSMDGSSVTLSEHFGHPIIINFWATWCPPCRAELQTFDEAFKQYGGEIDFMMVNLTDGSRDTVDGVKEFVAQNGYSFPVYFDTKRDAMKKYGISSVPMTVFIDQAGKITGNHLGAMDQKMLNSAIKSYLFAQSR